MAFKFILASTTGITQEIYSRLVLEVQGINLSDTPDPLSSRSIPFDGIDDSIFFSNPITLYDIGSNTADFEDIAIDLWLKPNSISQGSRGTMLDLSIMKSISATTSSYDGIYSLNVLGTGGDIYAEFRIDHGEGYEHSITSSNPLTANTWQHIYTDYLSASNTFRIYINGDLDRSGQLNDQLVGLTGNPLGAGVDSYAGTLDEIRLWTYSGASTSITEIAKASNIGKAPEDVTPILHEFTPSADVLAGWWRLDSTSAFQLFTNLPDIIEDYTDYNHTASPAGFEGADVVSDERTVISGLSASGALISFNSGSKDKGGLTVVDHNDGKIRLEPGVENLINSQYNVWTATGAGVSINPEAVNIFYGASSVRINAGVNNGAYQDISLSSLLYQNNPYTMSLRYRPITGSVCATVSFKIGDEINTEIVEGDPNYWTPVYIRNNFGSGSASGRIEVTSFDSSSSFRLDGLQVIEGNFPASFQAHDRMRKPSQLSYEVID